MFAYVENNSFSNLDMVFIGMSVVGECVTF